jgi:hypothetical protein
MFFLKPFNIKATRGEAGNMLLITGVIASAIAVTGGKVMLDRSTAQRKANQMAQSIKQSKEIPGSAAMIAKALISLPTHVTSAEWTTEKLTSAPTQLTNMPLIYPLPYVSGAIGAPAQPATSVEKTRDPPAGANWGDFKKDGTLSATVRVFTNDRTQASAQDVNRVMESQSKGGSDAIKRTESRVTYAFRNCDSEGKTSPSFTGIYCASADIKSDNFSGPLDKDGNATTTNEARAELGAIMPPPPPACGGVTPPSQIRPGDSFSLGVTAKGVVVGYEIKYAGKCLLDSYSDTGKRCNGNVQTPKSFPWNRPNASAVHTITNIPTSDIMSELAALIGANINQAKFEVVLRGVTDITPPPTCPTTINLPGPVSCEPNTFVVKRPELTPGKSVDLRDCEVELKKNTGVGVVEEIAISGNSHDGKSTMKTFGTKVSPPNFDAKWKDLIRCEEEQWKFSATLKRNVNGNISYATCNMTPQVEELKPLCAGVTSYSRTLNQCELKVDKLPNSHGSIEVLVDGKAVPGIWNKDSWSANLPCLATAHKVPVQLSRINRNGIRENSSCGFAEINTGLDYCVKPSIEVDRVPNSPNCQMKVKRIGGISQNQIKAVWRNYVTVNGSWNNDQWTSDAFECSDGGDFVGHLLGTDNKPYECGSKALDPLPPNCVGFSADRVDPKSTSCVVRMTRGPNSSHISKVLINGVPAVGTWSGEVWEGSTTCGVAGVTLSGGFENKVRVQDACGSKTIPPTYLLPPNCSIAVSRVGESGQCTITASGLGQSQPNLKRNNTMVSGLTWTLSGDDTYTTTTTCAANARTAFEAGSTAAGVNRVCKLGIKPWFRQIGNGNQHWFATYAIPGRPLSSSVECEGRSWQRIALENGFQNYNHDRRTWWKWENMCLGTEGRYNFTSCGDNHHSAWVNNSWRRIQACNDSWTTYLRVYNPIEPNYAVP